MAKCSNSLVTVGVRFFKFFSLWSHIWPAELSFGPCRRMTSTLGSSAGAPELGPARGTWHLGFPQVDVSCRDPGELSAVRKKPLQRAYSFAGSGGRGWKIHQGAPVPELSALSQHLAPNCGLYTSWLGRPAVKQMFASIARSVLLIAMASSYMF